MTEIKLYNRWSLEGVKVSDQGLDSYITLDPLYVPKTGARYAGNRFHKSRISIVERLMNKLMVPGHKGKKHYRSSGHITGKAAHVYKVVEETFKIIEKKTNTNPVQVLVGAVVNAAPREEIVTIEYGGARYPRAVECAPQRRVDLTLRLMVQGAYAKSFNGKKALVTALADEIIAAYSLSLQSNAIAKKNDMERQADASR